MSLMPIVFANNDLYLKKKAKLVGIWLFWLATELLWNLGSYYLEIRGENVFREIWGASILFFFANTIVGYAFIANHNLTVFAQRSLPP